MTPELMMSGVKFKVVAQKAASGRARGETVSDIATLFHRAQKVVAGGGEAGRSTFFYSIKVCWDDKAAPR